MAHAHVSAQARSSGLVPRLNALGPPPSSSPSHPTDVSAARCAGMRCAGCVSRVKKLLEQQDPVNTASVNLATETAVVRVRVPPLGATPPPPPQQQGQGQGQGQQGGGKCEAVAPHIPLPGAAWAAPAPALEGEGGDLEAGSAAPSPAATLPAFPSVDDWLRSLGDSLAAMLTQHGYAATMRPREGSSGAANAVLKAKREERVRRLQEVTRKVSACALVCGGGGGGGRG
jgi:cation transport ATPase